MGVGKRMFRGEPILDRCDVALTDVGEDAANCVMCLEVPDYPSAAVEIDDKGPFRALRTGGRVEPRRNRPLRSQPHVLVGDVALDLTPCIQRGDELTNTKATLRYRRVPLLGLPAR